MIGRIDSTQTVDRPGGPSAALLAIAALFAVGGSSIASWPRLPRATAQEGRGPPGPPRRPTGPDRPRPGRPPPGRCPPPGSMAVPRGDDPAQARRPASCRPRPTSKDPAPRRQAPAGRRPRRPRAGPRAPTPDPFALHPDRLSLGKQRVQLSVEVQASPVINLGKESTVRLVVTNESNVDASGVSVVYQLPDGLQARLQHARGHAGPGRQAALPLDQADARRRRRVGDRPEGGRQGGQGLRARRHRHRQGRVAGQRDRPGAQAQGRGHRLARPASSRGARSPSPSPSGTPGPARRGT